MRKHLLAAGIVRDLLFDSVESLEIYIYFLDRKKMQYKILDKFTRDDGSIIIRIVCQYNSADLIRLD